MLYAGSAGGALTGSLTSLLGWRASPCDIRRFPDGEVAVEMGESVRGSDVVFLQSTSSPVNDNLMELLAFADACRRDAARRLIAVIPYFGYARADRRKGRRQPVTASLVAQLIEAVGIDHVVTVDLHSEAVEGFFHIPVDNLSTVPILADALREHVTSGTVIVSPDLGRLDAAAELGRRLGCTAAAVHKKRISGERVEVREVVGDVRGRSCVMIDDMISTGATIAAAADALRHVGAAEASIVAATHGVFAPGAGAVLQQAGVRQILITDTIPTRPDWPAVVSVPVAPLLAEALRRIVTPASEGDPS